MLKLDHGDSACSTYASTATRHPHAWKGIKKTTPLTKYACTANINNKAEGKTNANRRSQFWVPKIGNKYCIKLYGFCKKNT